MGSSKMHGFQVEADYPEGSLGSGEAETGDHPKYDSYFVNNEGYVSGKSKQKLKRPQRRRKKAAQKTDDQFEDDREACSGTEEGYSARKAKYESEVGALGSKASWPSNKSSKRSRQLFFGGMSDLSSFYRLVMELLKYGHSIFSSRLLGQLKLLLRWFSELSFIFHKVVQCSIFSTMNT
jgi:hypothetical protein